MASSTLTLYARETKYEFLKNARLPLYALPTLAFPLVFYLLFGISFNGKSGVPGVNLATYLLASYGAFGVIGSALFGLGVGVAMERGQGWLLLKRATPMPPLAYFTAKCVLAMVFGVAIVAGLTGLGIAFGGVQISLGTFLTLGAILIAGALPFCAFGLALGFLCGPNAAPAVVNLVYLPLGFLGGLWIPIAVLPKALQTLAPFLPTYHLAQLAYKPLGADRGGEVWVHVAYLVVFTLVSLAVAAWAFRRDEGRTYG